MFDCKDFLPWRVPKIVQIERCVNCSCSCGGFFFWVFLNFPDPDLIPSLPTRGQCLSGQLPLAKRNAWFQPTPGPFPSPGRATGPISAGNSDDEAVIADMSDTRTPVLHLFCSNVPTVEETTPILHVRGQGSSPSYLQIVAFLCYSFVRFFTSVAQSSSLKIMSSDVCACVCLEQLIS